MRYAIIESGGKQYRAEEGSTLEVDRLAASAEKKFEFERILLMADGDDVLVGTPVVDGIRVRATVVDHYRGPKTTSFRYSPKKRIRVKAGHRQNYTRLTVEFIGRSGEDRLVQKPEGAKRSKSQSPEAPAAGRTAARKTPAKAPAKKRDSKKK